MPRALVRARLVAALLAVAAMTTACATAPMPTPTPSSPSPTPIGDGVLRIGTLFPSSGGVAFIGPAQVAGVNAAVREINAAGGVGGVPVEVINRDSGDASTQKAEESFADLVAKGVDVVIGRRRRCWPSACSRRRSRRACRSSPRPRPTAVDHGR